MGAECVLGHFQNAGCWNYKVCTPSGGKLFMGQPCGADFRAAHLVREAVAARLNDPR
jgi:hypothetical protein